MKTKLSILQAFAVLGLTSLFPLASSLAASTAATSGPKPTIVLVHGAFAESASWNKVVTRLLAKGYPVVAAANPLRGLSSDSDFVASEHLGIGAEFSLMPRKLHP